MAKFKSILNSLGSGEVSPKMYGRTDSELYRTSMKNAKNVQVLPQGGVQRRVGTQYVVDELDTLTAIPTGTRLIPFVYSKDESYLISFSKIVNNRIDIYNVRKDTWTRATLFDGNFSGATTPHQQPNYTLNSYGVTDPLLDATVLEEMQYAQKGNVMILTHQSIPPMIIRRSAEDVFSFVHYYVDDANNVISDADKFQNARPYRRNLDLTHTMSLSAVTVGSKTLTSNINIFTSAHIGTYFAFQDSGVQGYALVTAYTSATQATVLVVTVCPAAFDATHNAQWYEEYWSEHRGWPRTCTFFEGRAVYGGSPSYPDLIWSSQQQDIYELSNDDIIGLVATTADDPSLIAPANKEINELTWMSGGNRNLLLGTRGAEYSVDTLAVTTSIIPSMRPQSSHGGEFMQPGNIDGSPVYVQRGFRKIRRMFYDNRIEGYISTDITFLAEHLPRKSLEEIANPSLPKTKQIVYQELDNKILWILDNNGYLYYATLDVENKINAFCRAELGGTDAKVQTIASVPSVNGTTDELYLMVSRTIDSSTKIYLEKIGPDFYETSTDQDVNVREKQPIFLDCAKVFRSSNFRANNLPIIYAPLRADATYEYDYFTDGTGTETGTIAYSKQRGDFSTNAYVTLGTLGNTVAAQSAGSISFIWWKTDFSQQSLLDIYENASNNNRIAIEHTSGSVFTVQMWDSGGVRVINNTYSYIVPSSYYENKITLSYDFVTGDTRFFLNGIQLGTTDTTTATRVGTADEIRIGTDKTNANPVVACKFRDFIWWDSASFFTGGNFETYEHQQKVNSDATATDNKVIQNLDYLEGQVVKAVGDGHYLGAFTVSSGTITLADTYNTVIVGLGYQHLVEPVAVEAGSAIGSAQGTVKRIDELILRFNRSSACSFGADDGNQTQILFRSATDLLGDPIPLFTGDKKLDFEGDYERNATVVITGSDPLPCNITCVIMRGITYD